MMILVGGSTRRFRKTVRTSFNREPQVGWNPGGVYEQWRGDKYQGRASLPQGEGEYVLLDVTPLSLRIETLGRQCRRS